MKENDVIILDNDEKYTLLKKVEKDNTTYYMAAGVTDDDHINQKKLVVLKLISKSDGDYVEIVKDENILKEIMDDFKDAFK